jgi:hypothetical protein
MIWNCLKFHNAAINEVFDSNKHLQSSHFNPLPSNYHRKEALAIKPFQPSAKQLPQKRSTCNQAISTLCQAITTEKTME